MRTCPPRPTEMTRLVGDACRHAHGQGSCRRPLEDVVGAISTVAAALAALEEEHNIGHRDIKPGNLYELDGEWFVGDFGLITDPMPTPSRITAARWDQHTSARGR